MTMEKLTGKQRKWLRGQAHHLDPVVIVGHSGLSGPVLKALDEALDNHELIKIRFSDPTMDRKQLAAEVGAKLECEVAGMVGRVAIVYRQSRQEEKRRISLPVSAEESD